MHRRSFRVSALADRVLTTSPAKRRALTLWFVSVFTYALYTGLLGVQVLLGYTVGTVALWYLAFSIVANAAFYVCIRMEWTPPQDRSLGITQLLIGIAFMWASYAIAGPAAGATLIIVASHIVYAVFGLTTRQVWKLVAVSLIGLGLTMLISHRLDPLNYPLGTQLMGFLYTTLVIILIARLAALVTQMNEGLRTQRRELAAALEKVRELATRDDLTQVHNRRHITELMRMEQTQHQRSGSALCLALLDIDLFKSVNDKFGHHAGDEVLRRFADTAQRSLRSSDLLGRWGGEEFVVVFPDTTTEQARIALERVRESLRSTDFTSIDANLRITFSGGLVEVLPTETIEAAIERSDQAMYRAKTNGRDRIELDHIAAVEDAPAAAWRA